MYAPSPPPHPSPPKGGRGKPLPLFEGGRGVGVGWGGGGVRLYVCVIFRKNNKELKGTWNYDLCGIIRNHMELQRIMRNQKQLSASLNKLFADFFFKESWRGI